MVKVKFDFTVLKTPSKKHICSKYVYVYEKLNFTNKQLIKSLACLNFAIFVIHSSINKVYKHTWMH